jgi:carbon storage regulator
VLVLTRRAGESIMIGSDVVVRVIEVRGDVVRVGVDAPREVQVHREEVFNAVRAANLAAAAAAAGSAQTLDALRAGLAGRIGSRPPGRPGPPGPRGT